MRIGIMGTPIESGNLGCMALTYSLLLTLEEIGDKKNEYLIFDGTTDKTAISELAKNLKISEKRIISGHMVLLFNPLRIIKHIKDFYRMVVEIKSCDCIIDMTGGDSFSDIYGNVIFKGRTNVKLLVERLNIPLLLGPQTYGPYLNSKNRKKALKAINISSCVMTRDKLSYEFLIKELDKKIHYTTDMAFMLPYEHQLIEKTDKIRIGINVSQLLYPNVNEVPQKQFILSTDYVNYIDLLINNLAQNKYYDIFLIAHVNIDNDIHEEIRKKYSNVNIIPCTNNPIHIKTIISGMDIFIGARMHGTIAAFSSGVACIPTAYSPKFRGMFENVGYKYLIDLQQLNTDDALKKTLYYIDHYKELKMSVDNCMNNCKPKVEKCKSVIKSWLASIETK